jgi:hypothetical protein
LDGSHPSQLGTYLTACVFVATILGELPSEIPNVISTFDIYNESVILMDIDKLDVVFCQKIVEEILKLK